MKYAHRTTVENIQETHTNSIETEKYTARYGAVSAEDGSMSWTSKRNTVRERRTVICKLIFSPDSTGRMKPKIVSAVTMKLGKMIVIM